MTTLITHLLSVPGWLVVLVVFLLPALESSVFLGFVFPGELALVLGGVVAGPGHAPVALVAVAGTAGAIAGAVLWGSAMVTAVVVAALLGRHALRRHGGRTTVGS